MPGSRKFCQEGVGTKFRRVFFYLGGGGGVFLLFL